MSDEVGLTYALLAIYFMSTQPSVEQHMLIRISQAYEAAVDLLRSCEHTRMVDW